MFKKITSECAYSGYSHHFAPMPRFTLLHAQLLDPTWDIVNCEDFWHPFSRF